MGDEASSTSSTGPISFDGYALSGLGRINVLVGKNGCGKSILLKALYRLVDKRMTSKWNFGSYITPERSGVLEYDPNVDRDMSRYPELIFNSRLVNQFGQFKEQTMTQYRQLEVTVSRNFQAAHKAGEPLPPYFSDYIDQINELLDNVQIVGEGSTFKIFDRETGAEIPAKEISSGESELIALAIECLVFALALKQDSNGLLLLDEPDVHLHPDLQARLIRFVVGLVSEFPFDVIIATHSTAVLAELVESVGANLCLMDSRQKTIEFESADAIYRELLPAFGAHPLTQVFNNTRTILVEGDDDVRIWQEAVKTSQGARKLTPVGCGGLSNFSDYETRLQRVVRAIYDGGVAYSLRDRDEGQESIDDLPPVVRMRLSCRNSENLLLSDDVLAMAGLTWDEAKLRISAWCDSNQTHPTYSAMTDFIAGGFERKSSQLKEIRMLLVGQVLASTKPWEVLVGKAIGGLAQAGPANANPPAPHSLREYLGSKVTQALSL